MINKIVSACRRDGKGKIVLFKLQAVTGMNEAAGEHRELSLNQVVTIIDEGSIVEVLLNGAVAGALFTVLDENGDVTVELKSNTPGVSLKDLPRF